MSELLAERAQPATCSTITPRASASYLVRYPDGRYALSVAAPDLPLEDIRAIVSREEPISRITPVVHGVFVMAETDLRGFEAYSGDGRMIDRNHGLARGYPDPDPNNAPAHTGGEIRLPGSEPAAPDEGRKQALWRLTWADGVSWLAVLPSAGVDSTRLLPMINKVHPQPYTLRRYDCGHFPLQLHDCPDQGRRVPQVPDGYQVQLGSA